MVVPGQVEKVKASVFDAADRDHRFNVSVEQPVRPAANGTYSFNATLTDRITFHRIEETKDQSVPFFDEAVYDGDGLPGKYERSVTKTGDTDPDSDSSNTGTDESANDVIDGLEDFDDDGIIAYEEYQAGTQSSNPDGDGDELLDGIEVRSPEISPDTIDSDGDGTADQYEDLDNDTLTNRDEQAAGTHLILADTDQDGVPDGEELDRGLNATYFDTDEDGLEDGTELDLGSDPTAADSDGDGVLDSDELFTTTRAAPALNATVDLVGKGPVASRTTVSEGGFTVMSQETVDHARVSRMVDFRTGVPFENATVTLGYDAANLTDAEEANLTVYRFNRSAQTFEPVQTALDTDADTAAATVTNESRLVVMEPSVWRENFNDVPDTWGNETRYDSGSPDTCEANCETDNGTLIVRNGPSDLDDASDMANRLKQVVDETPDSGGELTCVSPDPDEGCRATPTPTATPEPTPTPTATATPTPTPTPEDSCGCYGGGDGGDGGTTEPATRNATITTYTFDNDTEVIQFNTSVRGYVENSSSSVRLYLGGEGHEQDLFTVTSSSGSKQTSWQTVIEDISSFRGEQVELRVEIVGGGELEMEYSNVRRNHDGDRFWDLTERNGIPTGGGSPIYTNLYESDSDYDGVADGDEFGVRVDYGPGPHYVNITDPNNPDSDGDRLDDYEENNAYESNPVSPDSDLDGYRDFVDPNQITSDDPPQLLNVTSQDFDNYVDLRVTDETRSLTINVRAQYNTTSGQRWYGTEYHTVEKLESSDYGEWYRVNLKNVDGKQPWRYYLNVTGAHNTTTTLLVEPESESASAQFEEAVYNVTSPYTSITRGSIVVGGTSAAANRLGYGAATRLLTLAGAGVAAGAAAGVTVETIRVGADFYTGMESKGTAQQREFPLPPVPATPLEVPPYEPSETPEGFGEIRLPSGAPFSAPLHDGYERGFGWEHIKRLPSINENSQIEDVIKFPDVVDHIGEYDIIIGETPQGNEVMLYLLEGFVLGAEEVVRNPPGYENIPGEEPTIVIDGEKLLEHNGDRANHYTSEKLVREIIENADEVWTNGAGLYYWVRHTADGVEVVQVFNRAVEDGTEVTVYTVSTAYKETQSSWENIKESNKLDRLWQRAT